MSLNYTTYVAQLSNLMVIGSTDANFTTFLPGCIDYAEQRIYRELDLLSERVTDNTGTFTTNSRDFTLPTTFGTYIVVEQINCFTPTGTTTSSGTRSPLNPSTKEFIDAVYPNSQLATGVPAYFAPISNTDYIVGPAADATYIAEVVGTQRPNPLSVSNSSTVITQYIPDVMIAASMVFATGYQRDFGAQSNDPQASQSWEVQYRTLMESANAEQLRAQFMGSAWNKASPTTTRA